MTRNAQLGGFCFSQLDYHHVLHLEMQFTPYQFLKSESFPGSIMDARRLAAKEWFDRVCTTYLPTHPVTYNGTEYTQRECLLEALRCDPSYSDAWRTLGVSLGYRESVVVHGKPFSCPECFMEAVHCDLNESHG